MSKRSFQQATYTPTATADNSPLAGLTYQAIEAGSATTGGQVIEIECGGQATSSAVNIMQFARSLVFGGTPTALASPNSDGLLNGFASTATTVFTTYVSAGTGPSRATATTTAKLNLSFNAFGGIVRWQAAPGEEWAIVGTAVSVSGSTLSAFTGGSVGLMGSHIIYEPY